MTALAKGREARALLPQRPGVAARYFARTRDYRGRHRQRQSQTGDARGGLASYEEGLAIIRGLTRDDPDNPELQRQIAVRVIEIGDMKLFA